MTIKLHPKHGLNPTISVCIVCGKEKNEIALLGAAYKEEAPMRMITGIEPCDECKEKYLTKGVLLLEATKAAKGPAITGSCLVLKDEAYTRLTGKEPPTNKTAFVEPEVFNLLMKEGKNAEDD